MVKEGESDILREPPLRYLGYANEVGEAFRAQVHVKVVSFSYGIASAYVIADAIDKGYKTSKLTWSSEKKKNNRVKWAVFDTLIWQGLASVIIPGFTINRTCALCSFLLKKSSKLPLPSQKLITTIVGLSTIPFIIKPIDACVDYFMEGTFRKYYRYETPVMKSIVHHTRND